jgi:hypothetical protein
VIWHYDRETKRFVGRCQGDMTGRPKSKRLTPTEAAERERIEWQDRWLDGADTQFRPPSKGKRRKRLLLSSRLRREHAFSETCDCVSCVSHFQELKAVAKQELP